jgi:hypothetical protein
MTLEQRLTNMEKSNSRIERLLKSLVKTAQSDDSFITPEEAFRLFGYSKETLRKMRYAGTITKFRCTATGRKFKYSKQELETLVIQA